MAVSSHDAKFRSSVDLRVGRNARATDASYVAKVPRKASPQPVAGPAQPDWFLRDWMRALGVSQARLAKECDWTASTMHGVYHGRTSYYREILNLIALKLNVEPYELLLPPERAFALRRLREDALRVVETSRAIDRTGTDN